ncbi:MAG: GAF domain-containing sensor histidine kinase [Chloroflexota bacterium]
MTNPLSHNDDAQVELRLAQREIASLQAKVGNLESQLHAQGHLSHTSTAQDASVQLLTELQSLNKATQAITADLSLEQVLETIVQSAQTLSQVKYAALGIHDGQGGLSHFLTAGVTDEERTKIGNLPTGRGILGYLLHQGQSLIIEDISGHASAIGFPENHPAMTSLLGVPIFFQDDLIGAIYLSDKVDGTAFNKTDQRLIEMLAQHAANAIENARLYEQTERIAILEERDRFAQDLHDGIIQSIYGVGLALEQVKADLPEDNASVHSHLALCLKSLGDVIQELRSYIFDLRPQAIAYQGLKTRLDGLVQELQVNLNLPVQADVEAGIDRYLSEEQANHLFHICHEALSNATRHAQADHIQISLSHTNKLITLKVSDNGIGFEQVPQIKPGHRGLANIQARVFRMGAILDIDSSPNQGTRLLVTLRAGEKTIASK